MARPFPSLERCSCGYECRKLKTENSFPKRILIYGVTGSGKTVLAVRLSERTGIPWHSVDDLTFEPIWIQVPDDEQRRRITEICSRDAWILDTAYAKWKDIPLVRTELIIALDYPRWVSLSRLLKRTIARAIDGRPVCNGNRETWRLMFSRDSIIRWHFQSFARKCQRIKEWMADPAMPPVLYLTSPRQADAWLAACTMGTVERA